jgi:hypothetical protein
MLDTFQSEVLARLEADATVSTASVLGEDAADFATAVNTAIAEEGMVVIIGEPSLTNATPEVRATKQPAMMNLKLEIAVGEDPSVWRTIPDTTPPKPRAKAFADAIVKSLQGFVIPGLLPLVVEECKFVPDKKRQLYNITVRTQSLVNAATT